MKKLKLGTITVQTFVTCIPEEIMQRIHAGNNTNNNSGVDNQNCTIDGLPIEKTKDKDKNTETQNITLVVFCTTPLNHCP